MSIVQWITFLVFIQIIHFLGTWKLYVLSGRKFWEALIPVYNGIILLKIIKRPTWWIFLLFVPVINLILFPVIWVETIKSFGKRSNLSLFLCIFTLGFYIYILNYSKATKYLNLGKRETSSSVGEWINSILFAIVAATIVHNYLIQPFIIPTGSLEKTLLIGDFLFVSKFHYGPRIPMTVISLPMMHDTSSSFKS